MRSEARSYQDRGWAVFPLKPRDKVPATRHGVKDATLDRAVKWWHDDPDAPVCNIGIATGTPSGLYVIDLDGARGIASWEALELVYGDAPTRMATTGRGLHLYYALPAGVTLGNTAGKIGEGIDSRGTGGYVLAPPSVHPNGSVYEWVTDVDPAPLPEWIARKLKGGTGPLPSMRPVAPAYRAVHNDDAAIRVLQDEAAQVARTPEGQRNHALFTAALKMGGLVGGGDLIAVDVIATLLHAGQAAGLSEAECNRTIQSGMRLGAQQPRVVRTRGR